jgi:hypothetical protein
MVTFFLGAVLHGKPLGVFHNALSDRHLMHPETTRDVQVDA